MIDPLVENRIIRSTVRHGPYLVDHQNSHLAEQAESSQNSEFIPELDSYRGMF